MLKIKHTIFAILSKPLTHSVAQLVVLMAFLTGCYKENDVVADLWDSRGQIANVSVWGLGTAPGYTTATSITVAPGANVNLYLQYFAPTGLSIKEIRILQRIGATTSPITPLLTVPPTAGQFDATARQQVANVTLTAPATRGATAAIFIDAVTSNDLVATRRSVTIRTTP